MAIERKPTDDLVAFDLYVRAGALRAATSFNAHLKDNLLEAARLLEQANRARPDVLPCLLPIGRSA